MIEMLGGSVVPPSNFQFVATIVADNQPFTIIFPRPRGGAYAHPREGITKKIEVMERKNRDLRLNMKAEWYDMIEKGIKRTEYREIKPYWFKRLTLTTRFGSIMCRRFDTCTFVYGYTKRKMIFEVKHIDRGEGKTEWGAEQGKEYFRIHLGRRLKDYPKPNEVIEGTDEDFF